MLSSVHVESDIVKTIRGRVIVHKLMRNLLHNLQLPDSSSPEIGKCAKAGKCDNSFVKRKFEAKFIEADASRVQAEKLEKTLSDVLSCKASKLKRAKLNYDTAKREHCMAKIEHRAAFKKASTAKHQVEQKAKVLKGIDDVLHVLSGTYSRSEFESPIKAILAASSEWDLQQTCEFVHFHQFHNDELHAAGLLSQLLVKKITNGCKAIGCRARAAYAARA